MDEFGLRRFRAHYACWHRNRWRAINRLADPAFVSFGLFAPHNFVSALTLTLCALAVSGAVWMILELEQPFGGLLHISPAPMRQAVYALSQ